MNPRVPNILSRLAGLADAMLREQNTGKLRRSAERNVELGHIYGELVALLETLTEGPRGFDKTAPMLVDCLTELNLYAGAYGSDGAEAKWAILSKSFLGFVRTDLACAMTLAHSPKTSDHDFARPA